MSFAAYHLRSDEANFTWEGRDVAAGIFGRRVPSEEPPIATAPTLEELEREARAYLGKEPDAHLFWVDGEGNVRATMSSENHYVPAERAEDWICHIVSFLIFGATCLFAAWVHSLGAAALLSFFGAVALYFLMLRAKIQNEGDAAVMCAILLFLILILLPAVQKVRDQANELELRNRANELELRNQLPPQPAAAIGIGQNEPPPMPRE
jgi:hypothetical protein